MPWSASTGYFCRSHKPGPATLTAVTFLAYPF